MIALSLLSLDKAIIVSCLIFSTRKDIGTNNIANPEYMSYKFCKKYI